MVYRRILYLAQFPLAVVLPLVVLISRGLLDQGAAWEFLVYLIICGVLSATMFVVAGLTTVRKSVRAPRAVPAVDAGFLSAWYVSLIAFAIWPLTAIALAALVLTVGIVWFAAWRLFSETRARFRGMVAEFEQASRLPPTSGRAGPSPRVIVINPSEEDPKP